jgi:hypothetical protein
MLRIDQQVGRLHARGSALAVHVAERHRALEADFDACSSSDKQLVGRWQYGQRRCRADVTPYHEVRAISGEVEHRVGRSHDVGLVLRSLHEAIAAFGIDEEGKRWQI